MNLPVLTEDTLDQWIAEGKRLTEHGSDKDRDRLAGIVKRIARYKKERDALAEAANEEPSPAFVKLTAQTAQAFDAAETDEERSKVWDEAAAEEAKTETPPDAIVRDNVAYHKAPPDMQPPVSSSADPAKPVFDLGEDEAIADKGFEHPPMAVVDEE